MASYDALNPGAMAGIKSYVLNTTCNQNISYTSTYTGQTYDLPDQLDGYPLNIGGDMTQVASVFASTSAGLKEQVSE